MTSYSTLLGGRAKAARALREGMMTQLYPLIETRTAIGQIDGALQTDRLDTGLIGLRALGDAVGSLGRLSGTQQAALEDRGSYGTSGGNVVERQVDRAIAQVLGRAPGRGGQSFGQALREAFPAARYGDALGLVPARASVSLVPTEPSATLGGQLSAPQAALYRQAGLVVDDAGRLLGGLQPIDPTADLDQVEALRAQIRTDFDAIYAEFGRVDEPRSRFIESRSATLDLHLAELGQRAKLTGCAHIVTPADETQVAAFTMLQSYAQTLSSIWDGYLSQTSSDAKCRSLGQRIERAYRQLPVIAQINRDLQRTLDTIGLSESERRSDAMRFDRMAAHVTFAAPYMTRLALDASGARAVQGDLSKQLPDLTVYDFTDWVDRLSEREGSVALGASGQYGLNFVCDQSNQLFWNLAPVISYLRTTAPADLYSRSALGQFLCHERVRWSMDNLLVQLDALADLAA